MSRHLLGVLQPPVVLQVNGDAGCSPGVTSHGCEKARCFRPLPDHRSDQRWFKGTLKLRPFCLLEVIRTCAIFHVSLGLARLPGQFARIPGERFPPSVKDTMDRSFHLQVPYQMPAYCRSHITRILPLPPLLSLDFYPSLRIGLEAKKRMSEYVSQKPADLG